MPIYNAEMYLDRTIKSIMDQSIGFENIELILVDDNSSDSSRDIVKKYADNYSNIIAFYSDKNHGYPGYGRNIGLKNASADYIMFIDNDDEYERDFCEIVYDVIEEEKCDVVSTNFKIFENSVVLTEDIFSKTDNVESEKNEMKLIKLDGYRNVTDSVIWTKIFKKSIIEENNISFVDDRLSEDRLFLFDYYYYAKDLVLIDYFGYKHYKHGTNLSYASSRSTLKFLNSYYDVLENVEDKYGDIDKEDLFRDNIEVTLYCIMLSSNKRCLLENLYKFEKKIEFNSSLNHLWATICNKFLLKQMFSMVLVELKILKQFKKGIDFLRKCKI